MAQQQTPAAFCDVFDLTLGPYGVGFRFGVRGPVDPKTETQPVELHSRVFMSREHLKAMTFVMAREVLRYERSSGMEIRLPADIIKGLDVSVEEWRQFWYGWKHREVFGPAALSSLPEPRETNPDGVEEAEFPFAETKPPR